jgi:SsrA-binding protein
MAVPYPDNRQAGVLCISVDTQMCLWVNGVQLGGGGKVLSRVNTGDRSRAGVAHQEPATLFGCTGDAMSRHGGQLIAGDGEVLARHNCPRNYRRDAMAKRPSSKARARIDAELGIHRVATNRRARHDYEILESYECGVSLLGAEVKSLRAGQISLQDAYARIDNGEAWLVGAHVAPYEYASGYGRFEPDRPRKLLLHREELDKLSGQVAQKALTLVPLSVYFKDGRAKVEIALARGKRQYDKRHAIAERDANRETARAVKELTGRG